MPQHYGDYRDTQKRWMFRHAPHLAEKFEGRIFEANELHKAEDGWTHGINDARDNVHAQQAHSKPVADEGDSSDEDTLSARLAALRRPGLLKLASEMGLAFDTSATADNLRGLILQAHRNAE